MPRLRVKAMGKRFIKRRRNISSEVVEPEQA